MIINVGESDTTDVVDVVNAVKAVHLEKFAEGSQLKYEERLGHNSRDEFWRLQSHLRRLQLLRIGFIGCTSHSICHKLNLLCCPAQLF